MHALSLHHLTVLDVSAPQLVEIAAELGCSHVCLFTAQPGDGVGIPLVRDEDVDDLCRKMAAAQISAYGISSFPMLPQIDWQLYEAGLARGAKLGGRSANARIVDDDERRATDNFARFADLSRRFGILPCIEFSGYRNSGALPQALRIIAQAGHGALTLDPLHIVRTGTPWESVEALDRNLIGYVQICDGPMIATAADYPREGPFERLPPGDGEFPIARLLAVAPSDLPLSIEVPCQRLRDSGLKGHDLAREIVQRTRAHLRSLERI